jgi:hypothetical protein
MFRSSENELPTWLEGLLVCCIVHSTASEAATILQLTATTTFIGEHILTPPPPPPPTHLRNQPSYLVGYLYVKLFRCHQEAYLLNLHSRSGSGSALIKNAGSRPA